MAALLTGAAPADENAGVEITVNIDGQRSTKGHLILCLTRNVKAFPDCSKDGKSKKMQVSAGTKNVKFSGVLPGTYAIAIVHDENSNNKMDLALFLPKEGFAMSRNPKIRMGKPKFKYAAFNVAGSNQTQNLHIKYIL